jgi:hypothetical protein
VAKVDALRLETDDVFIDLPTWREGRPDNTPVDFDFKMYSAQDRIEGKATLELITQASPKTVLSVLGGFKRSERMDYPTPQTAYTTDKIFAQGRVRYRAGPGFNGSLKYRYENTSDPLRSERGLLERRGREELQFISPLFVFYYQREDLRYLNATSLPTDYHEVDFKGSSRVRKNIDVGYGVRVTYDQNSDLDTLDVQHFAVQPNINVAMRPVNGLWINGGYFFNHAESRGPVTIPVFDG